MALKDTHIAIVGSDFYPEIAEALSRGAIMALEQVGASYEQMQVPGAFEIPAAIRLRRDISPKVDGFVALGCIIRGETSHYDIVAQQSGWGLMQLALDGVLLGNGILTVDTYRQAVVRSGEKDRGGDAARACLRLLEIRTQLVG